jgi:hypothetical protein
MRYLVRAKVKPGREADLLAAIDAETLGQGSVAGDEYLRNMQDARQFADGTARWVEVCYCATPLEEERPYWEEFFELVKVHDAHARQNCRDENGSEPWACGDCDCTHKLEQRLAASGVPFLGELKSSTNPRCASAAIAESASAQSAKFTTPIQQDAEAAEANDRQIGANLDSPYNPNRKVGSQTTFD